MKVPPRSAFLLLLSAVFIGCTARHEVVAVTETNIGVDIGQTPSTQTPHAKLGYQRVEAAIVPTNRSAGEDAGNIANGAASNAEVIMELRYSGIFSTGTGSGIYQRLAVGPDAVRQPGAAALFIRNNEGNVDNNATLALANLKVLETPISQRTSLAELARVFSSSSAATQSRMSKVMQGFNYQDSASFFSGNPTLEQIQAVNAAASVK